MRRLFARIGDMKAFPAKLRSLMAERRMSLAKVVDELRRFDVEVSRATVSNWTNGIYTPDMREGAALARVFGVSLDYLAFDELAVPGPTNAFPLNLPNGQAAATSLSRNPTGAAAKGRKRQA